MDELGEIRVKLHPLKLGVKVNKLEQMSKEKT